MVYVWIGFYMIHRLHVIYADKILFSMCINVKCTYDVTQIAISGCLVHFR